MIGLINEETLRMEYQEMVGALDEPVAGTSAIVDEPVAGTSAIVEEVNNNNWPIPGLIIGGKNCE
jgi:hypothetical protein